MRMIPGIQRSRTWRALAAGLLLLLTVPAVLRGAEEAEEAREAEEEVGPEVREVLSQLDKANEKLKDLTARIIYERAIPLLDEKQRTRGTLVVKKPDCIALELGKPRNEDVYTNGKTWWVVSHDQKEVEIYEASKEASREAAFLQFGYGSGSDALLEDYSVELAGKSQKEEDDRVVTLYRLRFLPRKKKGQERPPRYSLIEVELSDARWLPHVLVLHESGGEIVHTYELSKFELNTDVDAKQFDYKPPSGYVVHHPEQSLAQPGATGANGN